MMAPRPDIFAFASNEWHTPWWMARQHLFTRLATRGWSIVYSTGPQSLWERETEKWRRAPFLHNFDVVQTGNGGRIWVDRPGRFLPLWRNDGAWNNFVIRRHARHLEGALASASRKRIAYLWHPRFWPYVRHLAADHVIFHIHDAWDVSGWRSNRLRNLTELANRADLIISTAENMSRCLPGIGPGKARILPHGVDFSAISTGSEAICPSDVAEIPRPRIGYTGRVNLKLDFALISEAAKMRPDWHWVFVGATGIGTSYSFESNLPVKRDWESLREMKNVHFLGVKSRQLMPAYLQSFDVLALPFASSYVGLPTKLLEYLATGKSIVSWNGENVRHLSHLIDVANSAPEWIEAIDRALSGHGRGTPEQRIAIARAGDWNNQTSVLENWLLEVIRRPMNLK